MAQLDQGHRFGRLVVINRAGTRRRAATFLCRCDCGATIEVLGINLRKGITQSCGCITIERLRDEPPSLRHGHARAANRSGTYISWQSMVARCTDPNRPSWPRYGGRGITVCDRWRTFDLFLTDMGERPPDTSLDRIDPDGDYEPGNVRWASKELQSRDHGRGAITGLCRNQLHDITQPGSTIQQSDGSTRCRECRRESKRASLARAKNRQ